MATMAAQGTQPAAGGEMAAAPITDTDNNIINTYNGNNADENNADYTSTDGLDALGQATVATALKTIENTAAAAGGIREVLQLGLDPASGVGTANDGGRLVMYVDDDGNGESDIAYIDWVLTTATAGAEVGRLDVYVADTSGAPVSQVQIGNGFIQPTTDSDVSNGVTGKRWSNFFTDAATIGGGLTVDGDITLGTGETIGGDDTDITLTSGAAINLTATTDIVIPANVGVTFGTGEKIEGDNTDITITSGGDIALTATADVNIPANVGLTFGDDGEKIEGNGTDLTIAGNNINLTAVADVVIPANVGVLFGTGEKIEGDNTDLTVTSGGAINLTAVTDVVIPANVGVTFGTGEKIEGDDTDLTITSGGDIVLASAANVYVNDTANSKQTLGFTVNGGTSDNEHFTLKNADPTIPFTTQTEDDTFYEISKVDATGGGARVTAFSGSTGSNMAFNLRSFLGEAADTTKSTAAVAPMVMDSWVTDGGTSVQAVGADGNLAVIRNGATARFIFDGEGSAHADVEWVAFDAEDDYQLIKDVEATFVPEIFGEAVKYKDDDLVRLGLFGKDSIRKEPNGKMRGMMNQTRVLMLHHGTLNKMVDSLNFYEQRIEQLEKQVKLLAKAA